VSTQAAFDIGSAADSAVRSFQAVAVTSDRRYVLTALTEQAVAHFGRDQLAVSNLRVAPSVSGPRVLSYLATAEFTLPS
jgi:hypothetical protein